MHFQQTMPHSLHSQHQPPALQPIQLDPFHSQYQQPHMLGAPYPSFTHSPLGGEGGTSPFIVQNMSEVPATNTPFYPFPALEPTALATSLPFSVSLELATEKYIEWKESLWFTPFDFSSKMEEPQLKPIMLPYYLFDIIVTTSFTGSVGFVKEKRVNNQTKKEIKWRQAGGTRTGVYNSILVIGSIVQEDHDKLAQIHEWDLTKPLITVIMKTNELGPAIEWSPAFYGKPYGAMTKIESKETKLASDQLLIDNRADRVELNSIEIKPSSISYKVVYLPVYFVAYSYEKKAFKFFMNGQNGMIYGERPYGISGIVNGLKSIGSLFIRRESPKIVSGEQMQALDNSNIYNPTSYFILLPPSDKQLGVSSVGYITLLNKGGKPVQLVSQRRMSVAQGGAFFLLPHQKKSFDYVGDWVIEVIGDQGEFNRDELEIVEWATKGGAKGNSLGMKG
eukprot:TRINITY_DN3113_c0_g1_i2.p1 TRINITY_DN3113_c0_g1~~TRINITY_DN3113_c0_g1_i2.p1  ORF type:complete len:449 (+),score=86.68 TRINITY_DN3113_c0_g1_i2:221-1567(+)